MLQANIKLTRSNQETNYKQRLNLTRYKFTSQSIVFSHRPIDLVNFYCEQQVYLVLKDSQEEAALMPDYDSIYRDFDVRIC